MIPTLIAIVLLVLAVGIVVRATRKKPARPYEERLEQDTAWNDGVSSADKTPSDGDKTP
jgi:hypothetical protein